MVKNENYINIQGWMVNELQLKGNALMVYAIIYGFSQEENSWFTGTSNYLAEWCNCSRQSISTILKKLVEQGLIEKKPIEINNVLFNHYKAIRNYNTCKKTLQGCKETLHGGCKKTLQGCKETLHNNISNNINNTKKLSNNINNGNSKSSKISKNEQKLKNILKNNENSESSKISKNEKKLKNILKIIDEYDFNEKVIDLLEKFFKGLIDNNVFITDEKIRGNLNKIASIDLKTQLNTIQLSLDNGYKNLDPTWLKNSNYKELDNSLKWEHDNFSREETQAKYDRLKAEGKLEVF